LKISQFNPIGKGSFTTKGEGGKESLNELDDGQRI